MSWHGMCRLLQIMLARTPVVPLPWVAVFAFVALAGPAVCSGAAQEGFSDEETARLAAGELVTRPVRLRRGGMDLIGGASWQLIDAAPEVVWRALHDTARYPKMLPGVKEVRLIDEQSGVRRVHVRQGAWPVFTSYVAILRSDPAARALEFELDRQRPRQLNAGWGFARLIPRRDGRTVMAFGVLADVGHGLLAAVGRSVVQKWMLRVPSTVKRFLEHGGQALYRTGRPGEA
jgi:hypothetical protein